MLGARMRLVDLFCGTGGFARGAERAGLKVALAVDIDPNLTYSHKLNFPKTKLLLRSVAPMSGMELESEAGGEIDGIFGGPPCQGFSTIGRRDPLDMRRKLLGHFFRLVSETSPKFFVMENVQGLVSPSQRPELDEALKQVTKHYDVSEPTVFDASDFGAATKRKRVFVVGTHKDKSDPISLEDLDTAKRPAATVKQAIGDLQNAQFIDEDPLGFDVWHVAPGRPSDYAKPLRQEGGAITGHRSTVHTDEVIERFSSVLPGKTDEVGRHPRLSWSGQCPTLRAGTGSDKGSYQSVRPIHPDEDRVITVREAARLQGFPDKHRFHPTTWHSFRMIGNSVAPLMAEAIFRTIISSMKDEATLQAAE